MKLRKNCSETKRRSDGEITAIGVGFLILSMAVFAWFAYRTGKRVTAQDLMERRLKRLKRRRR
ncbi:hypothetical protein LCGC14_0382290 [marine sediment metagenome]|uniref:Uncharacterized protein n=1 Tax=marine sediment metagenome TaxID=412755 RepID=A0A0F9T1P1_9ZZZZ